MSRKTSRKTSRMRADFNAQNPKDNADKKQREWMRDQMFSAVVHGDRDMLKGFLDDGGDVNARDMNGRSLIEAAVEHQSHSCIHLLLVRGAETDVLDRNNGLSPLHKAAWGGKDGIVRMLLQHGADVNLKARDGSTALHFAVAANQLDVVKLLLDYHAKAEIADNMDEIPLNYAEGAGLDDIAELLRDYISNAHAQRVKALKTTGRQQGRKPTP